MTSEELEALVAVNKDLFDPRWRGIEFSPGWGVLFVEILDRCRREGAPPITMTKQKLGSLRIYFADQSHHIAREIRDEAMRRSAAICEVCGAPGTGVIVTPGFRATRCEEHSQD